MNVILLRCTVSALMLVSASAVQAQEVDESALDALDNTISVPVVQAIEPLGSRELRDAMRRIALSPSNPDALADAGNAALQLGDANAALNFFTRANSLRPSDGRIKSGLASATVRTENPFEALRLFDEAIRLGVSERSIAADRALAFDLLGDFGRAQRDYALAKTAYNSDELTVRNAVSTALSGRTAEADQMLVPLLQRNNMDAWRTRALILAARGDEREAIRVAQSFLDANAARQMEQYLRLMPKLTTAQQAAAIHFGHFPISRNIGRDSDEIRKVAASLPPRAVPTGEGRLVPSGEPLGKKGGNKKVEKSGKKSKDNKGVLVAAVEPAITVPAAGQPVAKTVLPPIAKPVAGAPQKGLATDTARTAVDQAARSKPIVIASNQLPPPETARPAVTIAPPLQTSAPPPQTSVQASVFPPIAPVKVASPVIIAPPPQSSSQPPVFSPTEPVKIASPVIIPAPVNTVPSTPWVPKVETPVFAAPLPAATPPTIVPPVAPETAPVIVSPQPAVQIAANTPASPVIQPVTPTILQVQVPAPEPVTIAATAPSVAPVFAVPVGTQPVVGVGVSDPVSVPIAIPASVQGPIPGGTNIAAAAQVPVQGISAVSPIAVAPSPQPVAKSFNLGDIVNAIEIPDSEQQRTVVPVDLKKIKPAAPKVAEVKQVDAKALVKVPAQPSRYWVQLATGSDAKGLSFDFTRLSRKNPNLFKGLSGWTAPWGKTKRLVIGPFADGKAAKKWEADYRKAGSDGFVWQSESGDPVDKLGGK